MIASKRMSIFERYLTALGRAVHRRRHRARASVFPPSSTLIGAAEIAKVNMPVAALIWLMIIPMLVKIDFAALAQVTEHWRGIGVTLFINWAVKPFSMAFLGWLFIGWLFRPYLPAEQIDSYIAGLILLAAAPCTAMVFVWSNLSSGEPHFTLSQVALNDADHGVRLCADRGAAARPFGDHRALGDAVSLGRSLHRGAGHRGADRAAQRAGERRRARRWRGCCRRCSRFRWWRCSRRWCCCSASRASRFWRSRLIIAMLAVPILIQVYFNAGLAYLFNRAVGEAHCVAGPSALIGASNFFELAVAAAISLFGFNSGAALATVVGVLIEVPVMLSVVKIVNSTRGWYEAGAMVRQRIADEKAGGWNGEVAPLRQPVVPRYICADAHRQEGMDKPMNSIMILSALAGADPAGSAAALWDGASIASAN